MSSTERPSFGLNSLLPQSYRSKAEAFAKCLQDKLKMLGGGEDSVEYLNNGKKRLKSENQQTETNGGVKEGNITFPFDITKFPDENIYLQHPEQMAFKPATIPAKNNEFERQNGQLRIFQKNGGAIHDRRGYSSDSEDSEDDGQRIDVRLTNYQKANRSKSERFADDADQMTESDADNSENYRNGSSTSELVLNCHKQSELLHKRVQELINGNDKTSEEVNGSNRRKLESFNSEDSTGESWCSCEETASDHDLYETDENEQEVDNFASQIRGSPRLRSLKMRNKRRGHRGEETWTKSRSANYSPPSSNVDTFSDFDVECLSPVNIEDVEEQEQLLSINGVEDLNSNQQLILLEGYDEELYDVPYRILRESSSENNLEHHFSKNSNEIDLSLQKNKREVKESAPAEKKGNHFLEPNALHTLSTETLRMSTSPDQHRALLTPPPSPEVPIEEQQSAITDYVINVKNLEETLLKESKESGEKETELPTEDSNILTDDSKVIEVTQNAEVNDEELLPLLENKPEEDQTEILEVPTEENLHCEETLIVESEPKEEIEDDLQIHSENKETFPEVSESNIQLESLVPNLPNDLKENELEGKTSLEGTEDFVNISENLETEPIVEKEIHFAQVMCDIEQHCQEIKDYESEPTCYRSTFKRQGGLVLECPSENTLKLTSEATIWSDFDTGCEEIRSSDGLSPEENEDVHCHSNVEEKLVNDDQREPTSFNVESIDETILRENGQTITVTKSEDDDSEVMSPRMKLRRCSSLKTWKTPPGTPGRKKIVRFADALGLDLADVRTFLDEIPKIPSSAYEDLQCDLNSTVERNPPPVIPTLIPTFAQPGGEIDFLDRVRRYNVCLENAILTDTAVLTISGCVRVRNLDFNKSVHVRYTIDNWQTFSDLQATYVPKSCDGFSDKFSFVLYGHTLKIGQKLDFAIRLECSGCQYWDNNSGSNYTFQCLPQSPSNSLFPPMSNNVLENDSWSKFY